MTPLLEGRPAAERLLPYVKVRVDDHHGRADGTVGLEEEDVGAVDKED